MEFGLIERIRARVATRDDVVLGIGDDAALLQPPPGAQLAVATDTLNVGVHFPPGTAAAVSAAAASTAAAAAERFLLGIAARCYRRGPPPRRRLQRQWSGSGPENRRSPRRSGC